AGKGLHTGGPNARPTPAPPGGPPARGSQPPAANPAGPAPRPAARHNRRICARRTGQSMKSAQAILGDRAPGVGRFAPRSVIGASIAQDCLRSPSVVAADWVTAASRLERHHLAGEVVEEC